MILNYKNIFLIIAISSLIGFAYNFLNPEGIPLIKEERILQFEDEDIQNQESAISDLTDSNKIEDNEHQNNNDSKTEIDPPFSEPIAIKLPRAYELYKNGAKFIDARTKEEFAEGHIKNSINIPFYESEKYESVLSTLNKNKTVITYCSGEDCDLSIMLSDELFEKGFKRIYIFYGGWIDWLEAGYPVESLNK